MSTKVRFFQKPLTLIVSILYFSVFIFSTLAAESKSTFLSIIKDRFSKTPFVLTIGEQIMDFANITAPLLLALAFASLFFLYKRLPLLSATVLLVAALGALCGITVFVCLNAYNIIETFNAHSNAVELASDNAGELSNLLLTLIPYHFLLIIYAGCLVNFSIVVKKLALNKTVKSGSALAFSAVNALLSIWHLLTLIFTPDVVSNYFYIHYIDKSEYIYSEISNILCFAVVSIFCFFFARSLKASKTDNA